MALEFDNEIDFLLRNGARQNDFLSEQATENHLDADDLAAFAENILPTMTRTVYVEHLAGCDSCRRILSNLALVNEVEPQADAVASAPGKAAIAVQPTWLNSFKKLFLLPNLAYATAGLAILLIGVSAFVILRSSTETKTATVAVNEPPAAEAQPKKRAAAPQPERREEEENQAAAIPSPTETPTPELLAEATPPPTENSEENLPPGYRGITGRSQNRNAAPLTAREPNANTATQNRSTAPQPPTVAAAPPRPTENRSNSNAAVQTESAPDAAIIARDRNQRAAENVNQDANAAAAPSLPLGQSVRRTGAAPNSAIAVRNVGGKSFQQIGGVWKDADYNSQRLTGVLRGSEDYQKLDPGLRSIAQSLSGEVIVVWQGKAYKIQ